MILTTTPRLPQTLIRVSASGAQGTSEAIGDAIEEFVADEYGCTRDGNCHYDALLGDVPVQIKGTAWRVRNGTTDTGVQKYSHGRFRLYESDHEWLVEHGALYAFCVYEKHDLGLIPLYVRLIPARTLETHILPGDPWYDNTGGIPRKADGSDTRIAWPDLFPDTGAEL